MFRREKETQKEYGGKIIQLKNVCKDFEVATENVQVIKDISFDVLKGDFVIIYGPSGCGKSTLLHIINGWERPTSGELLVQGKDIYLDNSDKRAKLCHDTITIVNQSPYWVKSLSVVENIEIPYLLSGHSKLESKKRAKALMELLGLDNFAHYKPVDLSGGQQQRVSMLRALINNPKVIMADEPTGNLDMKSSDLMMDLFTKINSQLKRTIIMVTHDMALLRYANKTVHIIDGKIENFRVVEDRKPQDKRGDIFDLRDITKDDEDSISKKNVNLKDKLENKVRLG